MLLSRLTWYKTVPCFLDTLMFFLKTLRIFLHKRYVDV
jgi:hypothetical protein